MNRNLAKLLPIIYLLISLVFVACEDQLPSEFRTDETYKISSFDNTACYFLSRDTTRTDTVVVGNDTTFTTHRFYVPVKAAYLEQPLEEVWVNASDSLIRALFDTLVVDTTVLVSNPEEQTTAFAMLSKPAGRAAATHFFTSWDLTEENIDAYVEMKIFAKDGKEIPLQSTGMELETIAGCTQKVLVGGNFISVPLIRARQVYNLDAGAYLVRFNISEPTTIGKFRLVIF